MSPPQSISLFRPRSRGTVLFLLLGWAVASLALANDTLEELAYWGAPKVDIYYPRDTGLRGDLHWIDTMPNGELAVSTSVGLYTFDGTNWERAPGLDWVTRTQNLGDGRAVASYSKGLAELRPNRTGGYAARLLTPQEQYPEHIHALKQVAVVRGHAFGLDGNKLIEVDPKGQVTLHELPNWSNGIFRVGDELYAIGGMESLLNRWDWERRELVDSSRALDGAAIYQWMTAWSSRIGDGAWLLTDTDKIIEFDGATTRLWPGNAVIQQRQLKVKCFVQIAPGTLAIGTSAHGLFIIDGDGNVLSHYSKEHGLDDVTVLQVGMDAQNGLWVGTKNSLTRLALQSQTIVFDERHGLPETVNALAFFDGRIFLGTPEGVYVNRRSASRVQEAFELTLSETDVTDLLVYEEHLFIAGSKARAMNAAGEVYALDGQGTAGFWQPRAYPDAMLAVDSRGIRRFSRIDGRWTGSVRLEGPEVNIYSIIETAEGRLFATLGDNRVALVELDDHSGSYQILELPRSTVGMWMYLVDIEGEAYVNGHPCLRWDSEQQAFVEAPQMHYYPGSPPYGFQWVFGTSGEDAFVAVNGRRGATVPRPPPQIVGAISSIGNAVDTRANCIGYDSFGNVWAGGPFGLTRSTIGSEQPIPSAMRPRFHSLVTTTDGTLHPVASGAETPLKLQSSQDALRIAAEFPNFDSAQHHQYRIHVEGLDREPPAYSSVPWREIANLDPGVYTIRLSARDATGRSYEAAPLSFRLAAPWYQRPWAYALYLALAVLLVMGIVLFYNRVQIRRSRELARLVRERTREIQTKNQELETQAATLERQNAELEEKTEELQCATTSLTDTFAQLQQMQDRLVSIARTAGKAEIATNVLHNVGNVLNSINISRSVLAERAARSKVSSLARLSRLLESHRQDISSFLTQDPKGKSIPEYLARVTEVLQEESKALCSELAVMERDINHVKRIIVAQQSYAKSQSLAQDFNLRELCETAVTILGKGRRIDELEVRNEVPADLILRNDKHRLLEILLNLIANAQDAIRSQSPDKGLIRLAATVDAELDRVELAIEDNGIGIDEPTKAKLFTHGFTTKEDGHGFGLHSSANAARVLGGSLALSSPGAGRGAKALLSLPLVHQETDAGEAPFPEAEPVRGGDAAVLPS